jgi:hypothetical protein
MTCSTLKEKEREEVKENRHLFREQICREDDEDDAIKRDVVKI